METFFVSLQHVCTRTANNLYTETLMILRRSKWPKNISLEMVDLATLYLLTLYLPKSNVI